MVFTAFTSFMGTVYTLNKNSMMSFLTAFIGAGSNIPLNLLLNPRIGVQGAAIATVASYMLVFVVRCVSVKRYITFNIQSVYVILNTVILFLGSAALIYGWKYQILIELGCLAVMIILNFKFLWGFASKILKTVLRKTNKGNS